MATFERPNAEFSPQHINPPQNYLFVLLLYISTLFYVPLQLGNHDQQGF